MEIRKRAGTALCAASRPNPFASAQQFAVLDRQFLRFLVRPNADRADCHLGEFLELRELDDCFSIDANRGVGFRIKESGPGGDVRLKRSFVLHNEDDAGAVLPSNRFGSPRNDNNVNEEAVRFRVWFGGGAGMRSTDWMRQCPTHQERGRLLQQSSVSSMFGFWQRAHATPRIIGRRLPTRLFVFVSQVPEPPDVGPLEQPFGFIPLFRPVAFLTVYHMGE
ncbi:MAG: hypothetical protein JNL92_21715 [Opitutaceae bacterium]|nr:hypothetical protein [Opitutaceae bacterium]